MGTPKGAHGQDSATALQDLGTEVVFVSPQKLTSFIPESSTISPDSAGAQINLRELDALLVSAVAIGEPLGRVKAQGVGKTVLAAIRATRRVVPTNTNLEIVLLLAPLAMAWSRLKTAEKTAAEEKPSELRESWLREMTDVLTGLTDDDTSICLRSDSSGKSGRHRASEGA